MCPNATSQLLSTAASDASDESQEVISTILERSHGSDTSQSPNGACVRQAYISLSYLSHGPTPRLLQTLRTHLDSFLSSDYAPDHQGAWAMLALGSIANKGREHIFSESSKHRKVPPFLSEKFFWRY